MECKLLDCHEVAVRRAITPFCDGAFCEAHGAAFDPWPALPHGGEFLALRGALIEAARFGPGRDPELEVAARPVSGPDRPGRRSFERSDGRPVG